MSSSKLNDANKNSYDTDALSGFSVDMTLIGGLVAQISVVVAGLATMIAGYITAIFCDPFGVTFLVAALLGIGGTILTAIAPEMVRSKFVSILSEKIKPKLYSEAVVGFRSLVNIQLRDTLDKYVATLKVDIQKMKNERDLALIPTPHKETLCFRAVAAFTIIDKQIDNYEEFKRTYIEDKEVQRPILLSIIIMLLMSMRNVSLTVVRL